MPLVDITKRSSERKQQQVEGEKKSSFVETNYPLCVCFHFEEERERDGRERERRERERERERERRERNETLCPDPGRLRSAK